MVDNPCYELPLTVFEGCCCFMAALWFQSHRVFFFVFFSGGGGGLIWVLEILQSACFIPLFAAGTIARI